MLCVWCVCASDCLFWLTSGSLLPIGRSLLRCLQAPVTEGRLRPRHVSFAMGLFCCVGRPLFPKGRSLLGYLQAPVTEGRLRRRHTDTLYYCLYYTVFTTYLQAPVTKGRLRRRHTVLGQLVFQKAARPLVLETVAVVIYYLPEYIIYRLPKSCAPTGARDSRCTSSVNNIFR